MASKRANLTAALLKTSPRLRREQHVTPERPRRTKSEEAVQNHNFKSQKAASRVGKRAIGGWFEPEVWLQFLQIKVEKGGEVSLQEQLEEAFNDYFEKHGKMRIA